MKLVWHIAKKDLLSHWLPYAIWVGLLVSKVVICAVIQSPNSASNEWFEQMSIGYWLAAVIETALCFLLAAAFILEDGLVGSNMFWPTRPISGAKLLAAKAVGIGLFLCVVPVLVWMPWWLYCGFGGRDIAGAVLFVLMIQGITVVAAAFFAVLAGRSSKFLLSLLLTVTAFVSFSALTSLNTTATPEPSLSVQDARSWIAGAVALVALAAIFWNQFTTRNTRRSFLILGAGVGVTVLTANFWNWGFWGDYRWGRPAPQDAEAAIIQLDRVSLGTPGTRAPAKGFVRINVAFRLQNLPEEFTPRSGVLGLTYKWKDGSTYTHDILLRSISVNESLPRKLLGLSPSIWITDPETKRFVEGRISTHPVDFFEVGALKQGYLRERGSGTWHRLVGDAVIPAEVFQRMAAEKPEARLICNVGLFSPKIRLNVPMPLKGDSMVGDGFRVVVAHSWSRTREDKPNGSERGQLGANLISFRPQLGEALRYTIVHPATGLTSMASMPYGARNFVPSYLPFAMSSVFTIKAAVRRGDSWVAAPESEDGYRLVAFTYEKSGNLRREWSISELPVFEK